MASSSSSPRSSYDVFLSFRGEDTRKTIVSHLYAALDGKGINTFKDDQRLEMGDHISEELQSAIEGSNFAVVVLSKNYATSKWCLTELESIMTSYGLGKLKVFPIFYGVDPSDVRHQRGSFSLERYQDPDKVLGWRNALNLVADLSGVDSRHCADEAMMLKGIVENISSQLSAIQPTPLDGVFGVEAHIEQMKPLLALESDHQVRMIGIWGMGGIGKTTIAKYLYEHLGRQFPAHCFMENVDQTCKEENLRYVQQQFLSDILRTRRVELRTVESGGKLIRSRLGSLKVFVVLDGVEKKEQLDALAKESSWFGPGSRIIITTRDKKLLDSCRVTTVHEVRCLENEESLKMLKHFAFQDRLPPFDAYEVLANRASQLAHGLPFALEAIGLYLCSIISIEDWKDALHELETSPLQSIMDVLKSSYIQLDQRSKTIFLKVACLFNGEPLRRVSALLSETETRIESLADKSLIHISNDGFIEMHSLIQQVGREIVDEESMHKPWLKNLLWGPREGYELLKSKTVTKKVEGMALHICELPQGASSIDGSALAQMKNLLFLKFFKHLDDTESKLDLISENYSLPSRLRLLHWDAYPLTTMPSPLHCLVELRLRYSNLESLWDGTPMLGELRTIDVTGSKNLKILPDFSMLPKFEELITKGCTSLERIPETIGNLSFLRKLDVSHCDCLMNLQMIIGELLPAVPQHTQIFRQVAVDFPNSIDTLNSLTDISIEGQLNFWLSHLRGKATYLSFSSEQRIPNNLMLKAYEKHEFHGFKSLNIMRLNYKNGGASFQCYSFSNFLCLTELSLINLNIKSIPDNIGFLQELQKLDLSGNDFTHLPTEMNDLSKMKSLGLGNCINLQRLPQLSQLETLKLSDCINLKSLLHTYLAKKIGRSYCLQKLWLDNCKLVRELSDVLSHYTSLTHLDLSGNDMVTMPGSIRLLTLLNTLYLNDCKKLTSLAQIPLNLTSLYARGCISLKTVYLSSKHSIKHFDLSYCPQLNKVEHLINQFLIGKQNEERFACFSGSRYFNNQETNLPQILHASEYVGFYAYIIIACQSHLRLHFSSSSYSIKQEDRDCYRVNLKPDLFLQSETTSNGEAFLEYHMLIFNVPGNVTGHEFHLETHLQLTEEFQQSRPVEIKSYGVRAIHKTQEEEREHDISYGDLSEKEQPEDVDSLMNKDDESKSNREITEMNRDKGDRRQSRTSILESDLPEKKKIRK